MFSENLENMYKFTKNFNKLITKDGLAEFDDLSCILRTIGFESPERVVKKAGLSNSLLT